MNRRRSRFAPALSVVMETLESRVVLSATAGTAEVAAQAIHRAATQTTLVVIIPAYSPRKNRAKRIALYSV